MGTVDAGAGAGTHQVYVQGRVFLAGPYKGAPLSSSRSFRRSQGRMTSGTSSSAARSISTRKRPGSTRDGSDSQIIEGVPLRTRHIRVSLEPAKLHPEPDEL